MGGIDPLEGDDGDTVFRGVILRALGGFVAIVLLLLPHLHPSVEAADAPSPGNVVVEIHWPNHLDADVDFWSRRPATAWSAIRTRLGASSTCRATTSASSAM